MTRAIYQHEDFDSLKTTCFDNLNVTSHIFNRIIVTLLYVVLLRACCQFLQKLAAAP